MQHTFIKQFHFRATLLAIAALFLTFPSYSQRNLKVGEEIKAPSTDAWNFIKYGEVGASLHTGTVNLSIPVYTYQDNDFSIPISLNYSSNGLVANMRAGILGPDWVLDAGGKISVEINGMFDFESYNTINADNYYQYHQLENPPTEGNYWRYSSFADANIELGAPSPEIIFTPGNSTIINNSSTVKYDAEPDIFHFNFMGYSGSFHLGTNNTVHVYNTNGDNQLHKIEFLPVTGSSNVTIRITDKYGYIYEFLHTYADKGQDRSGEMKQETSYNLTKITAPNGRYVEFSYQEHRTVSYRPSTYANSGGVFDFDDDNMVAKCQNNYSDYRLLESVTEPQYLTGISVCGDPIIQFTYTNLPAGTRDQYVYPLQTSAKEFTECYRLSKIQIKNPFSSEHPTIKTADLAYAYTHGSRTNYLSSVEMSGEGTYSFTYYNLNNGNFPPLGTFSVDHWGYYNGKSVSSFLKIVNTNSSTLEESLSSASRDHNTSHAIKGMLQKVTYPTGGYSQMEYESHSYGKAFKRTAANHFVPTLATETGTCGGLRIKSVSNHLEDGSQVNKKTYSYTAPDGSSSGILLHFPKYWLTYSARAGNHIEENINYWSNSLLSHSGSHIEYATVTQTNSDGSKETFHFSNSAMSYKYRDAIEISDVVNERTPEQGEWGITTNTAIRNIVAPLVSRKAERGKLLKHEIYAAGNSTPIKETTYTYDTTRALSLTYHPVYLIRKFGQSIVLTDNYRLVSKTEKETNNGISITRSESYAYNSMGQTSSINTTASDGTVEITRYTYPSDHASEESIYATMASRNLHAYPVTQNTYTLENGTEIQTAGKRYSYALVNNLVKPQAVYSYNASSQSWEPERTYTQYDTYGNLLESYDSNDVPTSYIWGYGGSYLVGSAGNTPRSSIAQYVTTAPLPGAITDAIAQSINSNGNKVLTTYHYNPLIGLTKVRYPNGSTETYTYNSTGKLMDILNHISSKQGSNYYSPDNRQ